jgi:putative addiction module component (TIGR02574 family)
MTVKKLKEAVKQLTTTERILFVQYILDTVKEDAMEEGNAEHLSDGWKEELEKRSSAFRDETEKTHTWEDVKARLINKHK